MKIRRRPRPKYSTIYIDPPWPERGGGKIKRGADKHYPVMAVQDIAQFPIDRWAADDCHLYLWTTNNYMEWAFHILRKWGFRYVTTCTWMKTGNIGLGQYFRGRTEHCLFAVRGRIPYRTLPNGKRAQGVTGFFEAPRGRHSEKPAAMRHQIEIVSPEPRIELFARERHPGWAAWGNEV